MPLGFIAFQQNGDLGEAACAARHSAPEAALWSRPRVAISSVQARPVSPQQCRIARNVCRKCRIQVINTLVLTRARWPVLTRPLMAGFHMATEAKWGELIERLYISQGWSVPSGANYLQQANDFRNKFLNVPKSVDEYNECVSKALYQGLTSASLDFSAIRQNATLAGIGALVAYSRRGTVKDVFSFNFDDILERYLLYHGVLARPVIEENFWAGAGDVVVHHPHGFLPSPGSPFPEGSSRIVLDERSFVSQKDDSRCNQRMEVAMQANVCLFVGLG